MGLGKYYIVFLLLCKKFQLHQNYGDLRTDWYNVSKIRVVQYHCTQFHVPGITVFRDMGHGQERMSRRTLSLKSQDLIGSDLIGSNHLIVVIIIKACKY